MYIIGGTTGSASKVVDVFNPATETMSTIAQLPTGIENAAATVGADGNIYLFGGDDGTNYKNTIYEWNGTSWTLQTATLKVARTEISAALGGDGRIYIVPAAGRTRPARAAPRLTTAEARTSAR